MHIVVMIHGGLLSDILEHDFCFSKVATSFAFFNSKLDLQVLLSVILHDQRELVVSD